MEGEVVSSKPNEHVCNLPLKKIIKKLLFEQQTEVCSIEFHNSLCWSVPSSWMLDFIILDGC